jgi:hypothetical protein
MVIVAEEEELYVLVEAVTAELMTRLPAAASHVWLETTTRELPMDSVAIELLVIPGAGVNVLRPPIATELPTSVNALAPLLKVMEFTCRPEILFKLVVFAPANTRASPGFDPVGSAGA